MYFFSDGIVGALEGSVSDINCYFGWSNGSGGCCGCGCVLFSNVVVELSMCAGLDCVAFTHDLKGLKLALLSSII